MDNSDFILNETLRSFDITLKTTFDLFSYKKIDEGTKLLIETMQVPTNGTCLDLGCGYGVVGITIAKINPQLKVVFVDRDFVAIEYTKMNCLTNGVTDYEALLSNGFSHIQNKSFNMIASNLPTHIAKEALEKMVKEAKSHLVKGGEMYVVTVNRLKPYIGRVLKATFGNCEVVAHNNDYSISLAVSN